MRNIFLIIAGLISFQSIANTSCGPYEVTHIKAQKANVLVAVKQNGCKGSVWKNLGVQGDNVTKSYQALVQQNFATNIPITMVFTDNSIDCSSAHYASGLYSVMMNK